MPKALVYVEYTNAMEAFSTGVKSETAVLDALRDLVRGDRILEYPDEASLPLVFRDFVHRHLVKAVEAVHSQDVAAGCAAIVNDSEPDGRTWSPVLRRRYAHAMAGEQVMAKPGGGNRWKYLRLWIALP